MLCGCLRKEGLVVLSLLVIKVSIRERPILHSLISILIYGTIGPEREGRTWTSFRAWK